MENLDEIDRDFFSEYGIFIVLYDQICNCIRANITGLIGIDHKAYIDILLEGLTAQPLMDKWYGLYIQQHQGDMDGILIMKRIKNLFENLQRIRNSISHGSTFLGSLEKGKADRTIFTLTHPKITAKGYDERRKVIAIKDLKKLNDDMLTFQSCLDCWPVIHQFEPFVPNPIETIQNMLASVKFELKSLE